MALLITNYHSVYNLVSHLVNILQNLLYVILTGQNYYLATFVHRSINYTVPYNNPSIPQLSTRFDYYRNHPLFSYNANYYYGNHTNSHIMLEIGVQHIYSNYTISAPYGTDVPRISVALLDGTLVNDTTNIILDDSLSPWTKNCNRTIDGSLFGSVPLKISVSFDKPISSLAIHKLAIIARLYSNDRALTNQLQYYSDQMIVSITVTPGNLPDAMYQRVILLFLNHQVMMDQFHFLCHARMVKELVL